MNDEENKNLVIARHESTLIHFFFEKAAKTGLEPQEKEALQLLLKAEIRTK